MKANAFRVIEFRNPSGKTVFRTVGKDKDGNRVRKNFQTEEEAFSEKQRLEVELMNVQVAPPVSTHLSVEQVKEAEAAFRILHDKSLLLAVQFFAENYREPLSKMPAVTAYEHFIKAKETEKKLRPRAIKNLQSRVGSFIKRQSPAVHVHEIPEAMVQEYVFKPGISARTATNNLYAMNNFFRFCEKRRWIQNNPLAHAERPKIDASTPQILSVEKVRDLFDKAIRYKQGRIIPYLTLATFAGIRPAEIERLTWADIKDLKTKSPYVVIEGEHAKKRKRRVVSLSTNATAWLRKFADKKPPFVGANFRRDFDRVRLLAGFGRPTKKHPELKPWPDDVLRHTAITHKLNDAGSAAKTALWAGNSEDTIHEHYKGIAGPSESKRFWRIMPDKSATVLKLKAAA
jgi:integrase/recombinase XerD